MKISSVEPIHIAVPYNATADVGHRSPLAHDGHLPHQGDDRRRRHRMGRGLRLGTCATTKFAFANLVQPLAIGRDADDIGGLMSDLQRKLANSARNGPVAFALSGLDIALWDIAGKVAGQPLYRMLGGEPKERVPVYASLLRYASAGDRRRTPSGEAVDRGLQTRQAARDRRNPRRAARKAAGRRRASSWSTPIAPGPPDRSRRHGEDIRAAMTCLWLEEPVWPPEDYAGQARVRRRGRRAASPPARTPAALCTTCRV